MKAKLFNSRLSFTLALVASLVSLYGTATNPAQAQSIVTTSMPSGGSSCLWAGGWSTNYRDMTLVQHGLTVNGDYTHDVGLLHGKISGNRFSGTWHEEPTYEYTPNQRDAGDFEFDISADCNSFSGRWRYGFNATDGWQASWTGTRKPNKNPPAGSIAIVPQTAGTTINGRPAPIGSITPISDSDALNTPVANIVEGAEIVRSQANCTGTPANILIFTILRLPLEEFEEAQDYTFWAPTIPKLVDKLCSLEKAQSPDVAYRAAAAAAGESDLQIELEKGAMGVQLEEINNLSLRIDTPMATMRISGANRVEVSHNANTGKTTFEVIEGSSDITPKSPSAPSFFLLPGIRVEISASGVTQIRTGPLFSNSFE